ncbi:arylamine n-acetyltransferase 1 [Colletotrichum truncatum]|uniref:Arylamine n-acetyltransferase 1 n=1 Tax=Colletotrichum truncatum TaxID=5467 RepID=A0ACC3YDI6_COLTU|nr:arylamine n-acetyltransferase 1 [Colletotrichum truncatum]KAF6783047.1 arylamine n-acetyltransferase 1 [Colletotrichum truncatum]
MASAYSSDQLSHFLDYIEVPERYRHVTPSPQLLNVLHVHTISKLPYENLSLHYNPSHEIDLEPQSLFRKMVTNNRGRGGFCMEIAILYNHILRAMGFEAYTAGVRTRRRIEGVPRGDFPGWGHIVNIVTFSDGSKYHADVAFGGDGATMPMPLVEGLVHENLGTQQIRLVREWLPSQVLRVESSKLWIYQYRNREAADWNSFYAFPEIEFLEPDWGVVNHWMSTHRDSNQVKNLLVVKFLRQKKVEADTDEQTICGKKMMVNNVVKQNLGGKTEIVQICATEESRISALEGFFDIKLMESEKAGIQGSALRLSV